MPEMVIDSDQSVVPSFGHAWGMPLIYNGQYGAGWVVFIGGYALQLSGQTTVETDTDGNPIGFTVTLDGSFALFTNGAVAGSGTMPPFTYTSTLANGDYAVPDGNGGWQLSIHGSPSGSVAELGPFGEFITSLDRIIYNGANGDDAFDGSYVDNSVVAHGGEGADSLYGAFRHANQLYGESGNDNLHGLGTGDYLDGGAGDDYIEDGDNYGDGTIPTPPQDSYNADTLIGGEGNDTLISSGGGDTLDGGAGNDYLQASERQDDDTLTGGMGDDQINGGLGSDTAVFAGLRSQYSVARLNVGYEAFSVTGPDGADTLVNIENLRFDDGTFSIAGILNEPPSIISNGGAESVTSSVAENVAQVATILGSDPDGDALTYSIAGGADAARFQIDAQTGALSFLQAPDFETPVDVSGDNIYDVTVEVSDGHGGSDTQALSISVTNVSGSFTGDPSGVPSADTLTGTNEEDVINGLFQSDTLVGLDGNDTILGGNGSDVLDGGNGNDSLDGGDGEDLLIGGAGNDHIEGGDGPDTFIGGDGQDTMIGGAGSDTLDYGAEGGMRGVYVNLLGRPPQHDPFPEILDLQGNTIALGLDQAIDSFGNLDEVPAIPNVIGTGQADIIWGGNHDNDLRGGAGNDQLLGGGRNDTIDGGEGADTAIYRGNRADYTAVANSDGSITITDLRPDPVDPVNNVRSDGIDTIRNVESFVFDDGTISLADLLSPTPPANQAPVITSNGGAETAGVTISENVTAVAAVAATDADTADTITYSVVGGADAALFTIDSVTGALAFLASPDFESPSDTGGDNVYNLTVQASDGRGGADMQAISVTIANTNDNAPVFSSAVAVSFNENGTGAAYDADAADADNLASLTYAISGADATLFDIEAASGNITFKNQPNFEAPADADRNNIYEVVVTASDGALSTNRNLSITIIDVAEAITINGTSGSDTLTGGAAADVINGLGGSDTLNGLGGDDILNGGAGADLVNGGLGVDMMRGGAGADTYLVDDIGDIVDEGIAGSTGSDTVQSSVSFSLISSPTVFGLIENLSLTGSGNIDGTGNDIRNVLNGNDGDNLLSGGAGNDTLTGNAGFDNLDGGLGADMMQGGAGDDTYVIDNAGDRIDEGATGSSGRDTVRSSITFRLSNSARVTGNVEDLVLLGVASIDATGNALDNLIVGNEGDNVLDGGAGADNLYGGSGNDTYVVDNINDTVNENIAGAGGTDTVTTSLSFSLVQSSHVIGVIENLTLTGAANINGAGNEADNGLTGNRGNNVLDGGAGNDILSADRGNDTLIGGAGDDLLAGGLGDDLLDGGTGADTMQGGAGKDTYVVDDPGDLAQENANEGVDTVLASLATFSLSDNVENLIYTGNSSFTGIGNALNNTIMGGGASDWLDGAAGNDFLAGGNADDTLTGGAGADQFAFTMPLASAGIDEITDFVSTAANASTHDRIVLDNANGMFTQVGANGSLTNAAFWTSNTGESHDANDRIIYNQTNGWLTYDSNGNIDGGTVVHFATLQPNLTLQASDFLVV